jgi:predicted kinase
MLYIFSGLPGTGKSALSRHLARERRAVHLRIDSIEQALREVGALVNGPEGYVVAYRIAEDNLRLGLPVVADSVNPLRVTRAAWREVATRVEVPFVEIEDIKGKLEAICFPEAYEKCSAFLKQSVEENLPFIFSGNICLEE